MKRLAITIVAISSAALAACSTSGTSGGGDVSPAGPARFSYGPFSAQYQVSSRTHVEQDFQGQTQTSEFGLVYFLSVTAADDDGVTRLTMTLDSVPQLSGPGTTPALAADAAGATFTGILSSRGEILDFYMSDSTNALVQQLRTGLARFFPRVPLGGAEAGQVWADSVQNSSESGGLDILVEATAQFQANDWVDRYGTRALSVGSSTDYTLSGGGTQGGSEITIDGTGVSHGGFYLGADGRFLGGASADTAHMSAFVVAMGVDIPILQTRADTVAVVR
jgi:predicted small secreted protein